MHYDFVIAYEQTFKLNNVTLDNFMKVIILYLNLEEQTQCV